MPQSQDDLRACLTDAGSDATKRAKCAADFKAAGGTVSGGKVFTTPDGTATFGTNGGKVFSGKKVSP